MGKNVIMLVVDALSSWYIQEYTKYFKDGFFSELKKKSYNNLNIFSTGPFTEAGLLGLFSSQKPLDNENYLCYSKQANKSLMQVLQDEKYDIYIGGHATKHLNLKDVTWGYETLDNYNFEGAVESNLWKSNIEYFFNLYKAGVIRENEKKLFQEIIEMLFESFMDETNQEKKEEYQKFCQDKRKYIENLLQQRQESSFYNFFMNTNVVEIVKNKEQVMAEKIFKYPLSPKEAEICSRIEFLNKHRYKTINQKFVIENSNYNDIINKNLVGGENRCLRSNDSIINHLRDNFEYIPTIGLELEHFLKWFDTRNKEKNFFSYIHVFDFHYQENIMENNVQDYNKNLIMLSQRLNDISGMDMKMSVSKTLSIMHIEEEIKKFWYELQKRDFFQENILVITADHGITNFMYPITANDAERWAYNKTNFAVPLFIAGADTKMFEDSRMFSNRDVPVTILKLLDVDIPKEYQGKNIFNGSGRNIETTEWINGVPVVGRQNIKFGIRTSRYSYTYETSLNEFFSSGNGIVFYDLKVDPDETINEVKNNKYMEVMMEFEEIMKKRWYELLCHYYLDFDSKYFENKQIKMLLKENQIMLQENAFEKMTYENYLLESKSRKIILYGASDFLRNFMTMDIVQGNVKEIWDNDDKKNGTYMYGYKIKKPYQINGIEDILFIITNRYEIESWIDLKNLGAKIIYLGKALVRKREMQ